MAKQTINIGTTANDGTGDPIRDAFDKCNDNFDELYTDDAGDVNSITATAPIERDSATGAVTISLADDGVTLAKMAGLARGKFIYGDASGDPAALAIGAVGKLLVADVNGDPSWTSVSGDATLSAGALSIATDAVVTAKILDNNVTFAKLENRYTAKVDITTYVGAVSIDWSAGTTFKMGSGLTGAIEFDFTAFKQGQVITFYNLTGSETITFDSDAGTSETFNKVGAVDYAGGSTNMIQVECIDDSTNAIFNYSVSAYVSDVTPS